MLYIYIFVKWGLLALPFWCCDYFDNWQLGTKCFWYINVQFIMPFKTMTLILVCMHVCIQTYLLCEEQYSCFCLLHFLLSVIIVWSLNILMLCVWLLYGQKKKGNSDNKAMQFFSCKKKERFNWGRKGGLY